MLRDRRKELRLGRACRIGAVRKTFVPGVEVEEEALKAMDLFSRRELGDRSY